MTLKISQGQFDLIKKQGEKAYPDECCGFLLGRRHKENKEVLMTLRADNARENQEKYNRFLITADAYLSCEKVASLKDLDILGFYHSHPNARAKPSLHDLEHGWPWYSYVIVSVREKAAKEVTSWVLQNDRSKFTQENIRVF